MPVCASDSELHDEPVASSRPSATAMASAPGSSIRTVQSRVSTIRRPSGHAETRSLPPSCTALSSLPASASRPSPSQRAVSLGPLIPFASAGGVSHAATRSSNARGSTSRWKETVSEPRSTSTAPPSGASTNARLPAGSTVSPGIRRVPIGSVVVWSGHVVPAEIPSSLAERLEPCASTTTSRDGPMRFGSAASRTSDS